MLTLASVIAEAEPESRVVNVSVSKAKVLRGETVEVRVQAPTDGSPPLGTVRAVLLKPAAGATALPLQKAADNPGAYRAEIPLGPDAAEGMYVVHVWTGEAANPSAVGKATFRLGQLVVDFFIPAYLDEAQPAADLDDYLKAFRGVGGNFLIAHNLITPAKVYYPSKVCRTDVTRGSRGDLVELLLARADREGYGVLLSVSWDMTRQSPYKDRMGEIKAITDELYSLYRHHPSLAGFYSYQEGSGTYFAPYVQEFSAHVKSLDPHLLTACAPHVDDPLLAGYLSAIEELDIIIYQTGVMASYRTDNRKLYPFRRVKDFDSLGAGAKRLRDKIAINHVELFGYLENRPNPDTAATTYENIYQQILSAATVTDADGIAFFTYHAHVHVPLKKYPEVARSRAAVADGMKAYNLITSRISAAPNPVAFYFPYSDWIVERWANYFLPALDAFRLLGIPFDVLPYAPPAEESVYPFYPFHMNGDVLARLLRERTVLVLPNVSGFQQTDSDLIQAFVRAGGVIVAFGPQIPMGRSYEREELFGGEESGRLRTHVAVTVKEAVGERARAGRRFAAGGIRLPAWTPAGARVLATFEDGSAAVTTNQHGKGTVVTIMPDAWTAARAFPELVRDTIDHAVSLAGAAPFVEMVGTNEQTDMAAARTPAGLRVVIVNHGAFEMDVTLRPLETQGARASVWVDLVTEHEVEAAATRRSIKVKIPGRGFRAMEFRRAPGTSRRP
jgi:hypothetical protein